jgi:hypothetical protein
MVDAAHGFSPGVIAIEALQASFVIFFEMIIPN